MSIWPFPYFIVMGTRNFDRLDNVLSQQIFSSVNFWPNLSGFNFMCPLKTSDEIQSQTCGRVGHTDGEGVERLWSYLRGFCSITKEMSPDKRLDVPTDGLIHDGKRLFSRFGKFKFGNDTTFAYVSTMKQRII